MAPRFSRLRNSEDRSASTLLFVTQNYFDARQGHYRFWLKADDERSEPPFWCQANRTLSARSSISSYSFGPDQPSPQKRRWSCPARLDQARLKSIRQEATPTFRRSLRIIASE